MNTSNDLSFLNRTPPLTAEMRYTVVIIMSIAVIITLLGNIGTILAFWKVRGLREKPSDFFILSLSFADLLMGLFVITTIPSYAIGRWIWDKIGCQLMNYVGNITTVAGILCTLLICWDRFLLISKEYPKYIKLQTKYRVIGAITFVWGYSLIATTVELMIWDVVKVPDTVYEFDYSKGCRSPPKHNFLFQALAFTFNIFLPLMGIEGLSVAFVVLLRRKLRKRAQVVDFEYSNSQSQRSDLPGGSTMNRRGNVSNDTTIMTTVRSSETVSNLPVNAQNSEPATRNVGTKPQNRYVKAAVTLAALVIALNVCLLPFLLYTLYISLICPVCSNGHIRSILSTVIIPLNSCINPILYAVTMSKIKRFYKKMFKLVIKF